MIGATWEMYETNVLEEIQPSYILSIAWKWLDEKKTHILSIPQFHGYKTKGPWGYLPEQEKEVVTEFHQIMEQADFLVAHNGRAFDRKKLNSAFIKYNLPPISPKKDIDTLAAHRRIGKPASNKLDYLAKHYGFGAKIPHTGKALWTDCMHGDEPSWKLMERYNIHDVYLLEQLYLRIRPYIPNHPNVNLVSRHPNACPKCGSDRLQKRGYIYTRTSEAQRFQCMDCLGWCQGKPEKLAVKVNVR